jgi:hypothetical protein
MRLGNGVKVYRYKGMGWDKVIYLLYNYKHGLNVYF